MESKSVDQVVIVLRCAQCKHEWIEERLTPLFAEGKESRVPPEDPAK